MSAAREPSEGTPPPSPLVSAGNSDRCSICGSHLAVDQRYCVECGTRRGAARFSLTSPNAGSAAAASSSAPAPRTGLIQRFTRSSSNASLLLGLLILLVALGIGVLIGHNGNAKQAGQPKVNVTLNSTGSSGSSAGTTAASTGGSSASSSTGSSAKATKKTAAATKTVSKKAKAAASATNPNAAATGKSGTAAAAKTFSKTATKKSTLGSKCTAGTAGCSGGKQTGNLF